MSQKIDSIQFKNYRAFYDENKKMDIKGKNLLVWGENGSGKSSFCKAFQDFVFKKNDDCHQKNMFSANDWSVDFKINDTTFTFDSNSGAEEDYIKNCAVASPFLDYRKILSLYFAPDSENNEVKLLQIFEKLLKEFPITEKGGIKLKDLANEPDYRAIFSNLLNVELKGEIINILNEFKLNFKIESFVFEEENITINASVFGEQIQERYHEFLNEARLSSLSISVYLAAIKKLLSLHTEILNILVLDDMLIGLDMGNRMAVFDIIKNHFANTQVFFFTYDKAWFEVFRDKVDETKWISLEMYAQSVNENGKTFEKPFIREKNDCWMKAVIAEENFDNDNCRNLLRKALEKQLDKYLAISDCNLEQKIFLANMKARENKNWWN
jgi:energy-coupling factor transporter ATP-binding protein EcfA2